MSDFFRGELVTIRTSPKDAEDNFVEVATAEAFFNYIDANGERVTDDPVTMTLDAEEEEYTATFDTAKAMPGFLNVHIRTTGPAGAEDQQHRIFANPANPDPEPEDE